MKNTLQNIKIETSFFEQRPDTALAWLGMAGALINTRGAITLIDPLITYAPTKAGSQGKLVNEVGYPLTLPFPIEAREIPRLDVVCYTHGDNDHFGQATAQILAEKLDCRFLAPPPVLNQLREVGVEEQRLVTAREYEAHPFGESEIVITPALHGWQEKDPWQREDCCGFLVKTPDGTIWHPGDTLWFEELLTIKDVDMLFFDVAAVDYHLGPAGSARLAASCGAQTLVAYHYGTFDLPPGSFATCDPEDALPYLEGLPATYLQPNPGEVLFLP